MLFSLVGLQIQLANKKGSQPSSFDFRWANFNQSPRGIDWHPLTQFEATYQHIRVHQLHDKDSLSDFWSMSIPAMMAVILINPEDSFTLAEKFQSEEYSPPVPVLVVTKETGSELLRIMEENPREMEARIETALKGFLTPNVSSPTSPEQSNDCELCIQWYTLGSRLSPYTYMLYTGVPMHA